MDPHIKFNPGQMRLAILDQRALPGKNVWLECGSYIQIVDAIKTLAVRGAPAIGVAGAWACVLAAHEASTRADSVDFLRKAIGEIRNARPTAVNLVWAVDRMLAAGNGSADIEKWLMTAQNIQDEDEKLCMSIGRNGADLIRDGDCILTHCNAGALATAGYGTALGVIRAAWEKDKKISVIADETRPLLQGARLTAYELAEDGIPVTVICDGAAASIMAAGKIQLVITGADRIAANGDTANKIGTLGAAICARHYSIPFYIAAPSSTIDPKSPNGAAVPIEQRDPQEVLRFHGLKTAPEKAQALNPAFDITPANLITGIITETGILRPPYAQAIAKMFSAQR